MTACRGWSGWYLALAGSGWAWARDQAPAGTGGWTRDATGPATGPKLGPSQCRVNALNLRQVLLLGSSFRLSLGA